jgi:hypothetical protein
MDLAEIVSKLWRAGKMEKTEQQAATVAGNGWTTTLPTVPGLYLMRHRSTDTPTPCRIDPPQIWWAGISGAHPLWGSPGAEWLGPLTWPP